MEAPERPENETLLRRHGPRFARFSGVGVVNVTVDFSIYAGLVFLGVLPAAANVGGFVVANIGSYFLNARITFRENGRPARTSLKGYLKFFSAHALSLVVSTAIVAVLAGAVGPLKAKAVAIAAAVFINYTLSARFVFGRAGEDNRESF